MRQPDIDGWRNYIFDVRIQGRGEVGVDGYFLVVRDRQGVGWIQITGGLRPSDLTGDVKRSFGVSNISSYPLELAMVRTGGEGMFYNDFLKRGRSGVYLTPQELAGRVVTETDHCLIDLEDEVPIFPDCVCK